jgi:GNAT superfamily N-acetyltransferase
MDLVLRRGGPPDALAAAELWLRARRSATGAIPPPAHPDDDVRSWFTTRVVADLELWLAEDVPARTLAGLLVLDGAWLAQLYVDPDRTGRGIGASLLELAKRQRPGGLRLWTFVSNAGAQRFYERHGFVEVLRTDGRDNEEGAPDIQYAWPGER